MFLPMPEPDLIALFAEPLNGLGVRYLVSGSVAAMLYGEPRVTHDIDFVVVLRSDDVRRLAGAFPSPEFYVPPADVIAAELARDLRGHFNLIHTGSGLKADFYIAKRDELHAWAFRHARRYALGAVSIALAPPEYVIVRNSNTTEKVAQRSICETSVPCWRSLANSWTAPPWRSGSGGAVWSWRVAA